MSTRSRTLSARALSGNSAITAKITTPSNFDMKLPDFARRMPSPDFLTGRSEGQKGLVVRSGRTCSATAQSSFDASRLETPKFSPSDLLIFL
jgi:hypothetical protein